MQFSYRSYDLYDPPAETKPGWSDRQKTSCADPVLEFEVDFTDGGQFSEEYGCENLLKSNNTCYCTRQREGVNVVLKYVGGRSFNLSAIEIAAPTEGYSSPLGQGVAFVTWDYPDVRASNRFNWIRTQTEFRDACQPQFQGVETTSDDYPVAFFDLSARSQMCCTLDTPRAGRYVLIKLLRPRLNTGENIDVQYVGLHGWSGARGFGSSSLA